MHLQLDFKNSGGIFDLEVKQKDLEELEKEALSTEFWENTQRVQTVNQQISSLKEEINEFDNLANTIDDIQVLFELAIEENEPDIQSEIETGLESIGQQFEKIELKLMLDDEFDENNAIINIHPGAGGVDAQD